MRSTVALSAKICRARPRNACCSSVNEKSTLRPLSARDAGHAETHPSDDLALHFVDSTTKGVDLRRAAHGFDLSVDRGERASTSEVRFGTEDVQQAVVDVGGRLGAEHFDRG